MARGRPKKIKMDEIKEETKPEAVPEVAEVKGLAPIDHQFGNGDLTILKDKINEIIANK